jgi:ATP:ADP antiporter, AAA family
MIKSKKILSVMDIEAQEASIVFLLLTQSIFLGIFYGALDTASSSLFLSIFPAEKLPIAFSISGVAGILMTTLYSTLQSRIQFSKLAILNIATVAIITFFLWFGFSFTDSKWLVFLLLVMLGPLNIVAMLGFWGTAGRIFSLRQGKRLFGLIDAGQIIGVIIASYSVPIILSFSIKTKDILFLSTCSAVIALLFQFIISFRTDKLSQKVVVVKEKHDDGGFFALFKNKFVRLMAIFVALSMIVAFFVSYSFLAVTKIKYPDVVGFASFFGVFVGTVMFITLMIKTLLYGKLMKTYGLQTALLISPVVLVVISVIAAIVGIFGGYSGTEGGFIFFFLLIALSRLLSVALKSAVEAPSFKILYQTIDSKVRHNVQARVDGTVNEISALASGLILLGLSALAFIKLINFTQALIVILALWLWIAYKLYKAYKNNLEQSLVKQSSSEETSTTNATTGIVSKVLHGNEKAEQVLFVMNVQEKIQPVLYEKLLPYLLHHRLDEIKKYAFQQCTDLRVYESLDTLKDFDIASHQKESEKLTHQLTTELADGFLNERILTLSRSKITSDRELAARLIGESKNPDFIGHLKFLLRDIDTNVKIAAIKASSKLKRSELAPVLAEFLTSDVYGRYAFDALIETGEPSIECLEHIFSKAGNDSVLSMRIVRIIGSIGGEKACINLLHKINYHDADVARLSASLLIKLKFKVNEDQYYLVNQALLQMLHITAWNIAARASVANIDVDNNLKIALNDEVHQSFDHLFSLLSLAFDANSISHIRENIESESSESTDYAIELLELIIPDDIKPMLFPIIDDSSDLDKIKQLQNFFPVDVTPLNELLLDIINRDYNYLNTWTKACALKVLLSSDKVEITDNLVAQLFNPIELLSELAVCIVHKNDKEKLPKYFKRLGERNRIKLQRDIDRFSSNTELLLYSKVHFLKNTEYFKQISGNILLQLAKKLEILNYSEGDDIDSLDEDLNVMVYIIQNGEVNEKFDDGTEGALKEGELFSGIFAPHYPKNFPQYTAKENVKVFCLYQEALDKLLFDYPEMAERIIHLKINKENLAIEQ